MIPRTIFTPEHESFRDTVRRFIETEVTPPASLIATADPNLELYEIETSEFFSFSIDEIVLIEEFEILSFSSIVEIITLFSALLYKNSLPASI